MLADSKEPLVDAKKLAEFLSVRKEYIYVLMRQGMPHYRIGNRKYVRFVKSEVLDWIKTNPFQEENDATPEGADSRPH